MPSVRFQVFVSSTYEDLKEERAEAIKAILKLGHIPVGMEMFNAGDEDQWKLIQRHIRESDYYIVIVAHRYGSLDGRISFTEKEFDYAVSVGIPVIRLLIASDAVWPGNKFDDGSRKKKLTSFKTKLTKSGKMVDFWRNKDDLQGKVAISLSSEITANPRRGWVPTPNEPSPEIAAELSRLSSENAELRQRIAVTGIDFDTSEFVQGDDEVIINLSADGKENSHINNLTWNEILVHFGTAILANPTEYVVKASVGKALGVRIDQTRVAQPLREEYDRLKTQLIALEFIIPSVHVGPRDRQTSEGFRTETAVVTCLELSQKGMRQYAKLQAIRRG